MANERNRPDPDAATAPEVVPATPADASAGSPLDPNDEVPVPIAMYPAEIDERAQVVEALREESNDNRIDDVGLTP